MNLQTGDYIVIKDYDKNNFFSDKHFKKLLNKPTLVWNLDNRGIYVSHPDLDLVPLNSDIVFVKIDNNNLPSNRKDYKRKFKEFEKLSSNVLLPSEKPFLEYLKNNIREEEEKLSKYDEKLISYIERIEEGDFDFFQKFFNGLENYLFILSKRGLLQKINPFNSVYSDYQNTLFWSFKQNDPSFIWKIVDQYFSDVIKVGDKYYVDIDSGAELAQFYREDRDLSEDTIANILDGEQDWDPFYEVTDDVYRDCYDELKPEKQLVVKQKIKEELISMGTIDITYQTPELFSEISKEQGSEDTLQLNEETISRILEDDESVEYLINEEMDDIRGELYSLYSNCYSSAWYDEAYDDVWRPLIGFVVDDNKPEDYQYKKQVWNKEGKREEKTVWGRRYEATKCIYETVNDWLNYFKDSTGYNAETIEYYGSYLGVLKHLCDDGDRDYLRTPSLPDYADSRLVDRCINDSFGDYF